MVGHCQLDVASGYEMLCLVKRPIQFFLIYDDIGGIKTVIGYLRAHEDESPMPVMRDVATSAARIDSSFAGFEFLDAEEIAGV